MQEPCGQQDPAKQRTPAEACLLNDFTPRRLSVPAENRVGFVWAADVMDLDGRVEAHGQQQMVSCRC